MQKQYNVYVIKQMVNEIASCDSYASFVLSNLPRASITQ